MTRIELLAKANYFAHDFDRTRRWNIYYTGFEDGFRELLKLVDRCLQKPNNLEKIESINNLIKEFENEGWKRRM